MKALGYLLAGIKLPPFYPYCLLKQKVSPLNFHWTFFLGVCRALNFLAKSQCFFYTLFLSPLPKKMQGLILAGHPE